LNQTTGRNNPEHTHLHTHCAENLKSQEGLFKMPYD
jgi:hypothetical protein